MSGLQRICKSHGAIVIALYESVCKVVSINPIKPITPIQSAFVVLSAGSG